MTHYKNFKDAQYNLTRYVEVHCDFFAVQAVQYNYIIVNEGKYQVKWCLSHSDIAYWKLTYEADFEEATRTLYHPGDAVLAEERTICEVLGNFQGSYARPDKADIHFYGFGAGLDDEYHRRVCELVDVEGRLQGIGTYLNLGALMVEVPHPFFQAKGVSIHTGALEFVTGTMSDRRDHLEKLRRAVDKVELLERSLESLA